jgi:hypothetical protein
MMRVKRHSEEERRKEERAEKSSIGKGRRKLEKRGGMKKER